MNLPFVLCLAILPTVLPAQTMVISTASKETAPASWETQLKKNLRGTLVVQDDQDGTWGLAFNQLRTQEPLLELNLPLIQLGPKNPLTTIVRAKEGWDEKPRWALFNSEGRALIVGTSIPWAEALADSIRGAGVKSRIEELTEFLRLDPDHLDGRTALLGEYESLAERRMAPRIEYPKETPLAGASSTGEASPELKSPLSDEDDQRIWGAFADTLFKIIQSGDWTRDGGFWAGNLQSMPKFSPLVQAAARRSLPEVEASLRRSPSHHMTWALWLRLSEYTGGRSLHDFLQTLTPVPGSTREFPSSTVVLAYVKECRSTKDWYNLKAFMEPRWAQKNENQISVFAQNEADKDFATKYWWTENAEPLLEACLRMRDIGAADRVMAEAMERMRSKYIARLGSELATRCGQPGVAARWAALTPPGSK